MSDQLPADLVPIVVMLWMNLHTAKRRGLITSGSVEMALEMRCPECGKRSFDVFVENNGDVSAWCNELCGYGVNLKIEDLMPSSPDGVGIADYEVTP